MHVRLKSLRSVYDMLPDPAWNKPSLTKHAAFTLFTPASQLPESYHSNYQRREERHKELSPPKEELWARL